MRYITSATANLNKLVEVQDLMASLGHNITLRARPVDLADVVEDGLTLAANAELKAVAVSRHTETVAMADDTGLEVDALDGAPGVRSARFAGEDAVDADNVSLLLERLAGVADKDRTARFRTVICLSGPDGELQFADGVCEGTISHEPRGEGGFGYDPVFIPNDGDGRAFAEMDRVEKNEISHRGRAIRSAVELIDSFFEPEDDETQEDQTQDDE